MQTDSVTGSPPYTVTVTNIPVGVYTALIQVLDANGTTLAQARYGFKSQAGKVTEPAGVLPVGIAVDGTGACTPSNISIPVGTTLYWENWDSAAPHTVRMNAGAVTVGPIPAVARSAETGTSSVSSASHTFTSAGTYKYDSGSGAPGAVLVYETGTVSGVVTRESDKFPVEGAEVFIGATRVLTGADGSFVLRDVPMGPRRLVVDKYGFSTWFKDLDVAGNQTTNQDASLVASERWYLQNPLPGNSDFHRVQFVNASVGWVVGWQTILHTIDGGASWMRQKVPGGTTGGDDLWAMFFVDTLNGWIVGDGQRLYHTTDGGTTWKQLGALVGNNLFGLYFADLKRGWAVGGEGSILKTTDGGETWSSQKPTTVALYDVTFVDDRKGWIAGAGVLLQTSDGGASCTAVPGVPDTNLYRVFFRTSQEGWIAGQDGTILHTIDGGTTWTPSATGVAAADSLWSVYFTDALNGCVVGRKNADKTKPVSYRTSDGGMTWTESVVGAPSEGLESVWMTGGTTGWSVGQSGTLLHTTDGGATWTSRTKGEVASLGGVHFADDMQGWAVGSGGTILHTTDGGRNWQAQNSGTTESFQSVYFTSASHGCAVGWDLGQIWYTRDGGTTWINAVDDASYGHNSVCFVDDDHGWAAGYGGWVLRTTDGGATWVPSSIGVNWTIQSVAFSDVNTGHVMANHYNSANDTYDAFHFKSTDGGQTWGVTGGWGGAYVRSLFFLDSQRGWAVGRYDSGGASYREVLTTTDGGASWSSRGFLGSEYTDVHFIDSIHGWATRKDGRVDITYDGGKSWIVQEVPECSWGLWGLWATGPSAVWAVGGQGTIVHFPSP